MCPKKHNLTLFKIFMTHPDIPVLLLTGYLGSGKTTLLNRILTNQRGIRFAVIVNDIGEVNIDATLIQQGGVVNIGDASLVALQNGCICCTLQSDLIEQLHDIIAQKRFDYIVIEASGICEPAPIAQTICSMAGMEEKYIRAGVPRVDCIVTVVDALRMQTEFCGGHDLMNPRLQEEDIENLIIQQVEFCNIILLNKADEVSAEQLEETCHILHALQPHAEIIPCNYADVELGKLLDTNLFRFSDVATSAGWIQQMEEHHAKKHEHEHHHEHHDGHHHHHHHEEGEAEEYGISTFVYYRREPFSLEEFDQFVARQWPREIIRTKGVCYFYGEEDACYVFEQAGTQVSLRHAGQWYAAMPEEELKETLQKNPTLRADWHPIHGDRMQKIVFIGRNMDRMAIMKMLDGCLAE